MSRHGKKLATKPQILLLKSLGVTSEALRGLTVKEADDLITETRKHLGLPSPKRFADPVDLPFGPFCGE